MPLFRDPVAMPIKSELNTEEDSLIYDEKTGFYNAVYPPDQPAIRTSGVQSTKTGEWQIKPKYENIYFENNLFICLFHAEDGMNEIAYYDIYKKNGDQIVPTEYMGIKSNRELPKNLFSDSELIFDRDSTFYYIKSAEGMGLKSLYLFDSECNSDYTVTIPDFLHFSNETIFEPRYEFAHKIGNDYSYLAAYGDNGFEFIKRSWGQVPKDFHKFPIPIRESIKIYRDVEIFLDYIVIDDITYLDTCVGEVCLQKIDRSYFFSDNHLGLEKIGDSLIYLKYHIPELIDQYTMPYIEDMWGEDSIAYNPETGHYETVYPPNDPGVYESGIFDLKTQKWLISPTNAWVLQSYGGFLISKAILDDNLNLLHYECSFQNNEGSFLFENMLESELYEDRSYDHLFVPNYKVDSLYLSNFQYSNDTYYFTSDGNTGLVDLNRSNILHIPEPYLYHQTESNSFISINNARLHYENAHFDTVIDLKNCTNFEAFTGDHGFALQAENDHGNTNLLFEDRTKLDFEVDGWKKPRFDPDSTKKYIENGKKEKHKVFYVKQVNDSLIYIEDWNEDFRDPNAVPLRSFMYPAEDSIIYNPNTGFYYGVYPADLAGYYRSGIYDYANGNWFIPADNRIVVPYNNEYILFVPTLNELDITIGYKFSIVNAAGERLMEKKAFNELPIDYQAFLMTRPELKAIFHQYEAFKLH